MGLCTLADVELENKGIGQNQNAEPVLEGKAYIVSEAISWVTSRIETICNQPFAPIRLSDWYDAPPCIPADPSISGAVFLHLPLVDVAAFSYEDSSLVGWTPAMTFAQRAGLDYYLSPIGGRTPYKVAYLNARWQTFSPLALFGGNSQQVIQIDGLWCARQNYSIQGWPNSQQTVQNSTSISATDNTLLVTSANAFSPGQWIRFHDAVNSADDEIALATETNTMANPNIVTILRGERNTTATTHLNGCEIDLWSPDPDINRAATLWCAYLYSRRAVFETLRVTMGASGSISQVFPKDAPEEVANILGKHMNGWTLGTSGWTE